MLPVLLVTVPVAISVADPNELNSEHFADTRPDPIYKLSYKFGTIIDYKLISNLEKKIEKHLF